jgi:6-phosphogluconolactonase
MHLFPSGHAVSRRRMLLGAAALPFARALPAAAQPPAGLLAYVGTYTPDGEGIHLVRVDTVSGAITQIGVTRTQNPSWLALSPDRRFLYAVNELDNYNGGKNGAVSAFAVDHASGALTPLNTVDSGGATPAFVSVHPSGRFVFVANYGGGSVAVFPVQPDGRLGAIADLQHDAGGPHPARAADNPPGNFAPSDHAASHMHMVAADPAGRFVIANDAGLDEIRIWALDAATGKLTPAATTAVQVTPGAAPRHFVFHPTGGFLFNLQEQDGRLASYAYDGASGRLTLRQSISILPPNFAGSNLASELVIAHDGRFLYAANRLHDTIVQVRVSRDGGLSVVNETWVRGDYPRSFALAPDGRMLFSCNQKSDAITAFHVDPANGRLRFAEQYIPLGSPVNLTFLA